MKETKAMRILNGLEIAYNAREYGDIFQKEKQ